MDRSLSGAKFESAEVDGFPAKGESAEVSHVGGIAARFARLQRRIGRACAPRPLAAPQQARDSCGAPHADAHHAVHLGNSSTIVVPWPSPALSAKTLPPCFSAMARTMNRPNPVPFTCARERWVTR